MMAVVDTLSIDVNAHTGSKSSHNEAGQVYTSAVSLTAGKTYTLKIGTTITMAKGRLGDAQFHQDGTAQQNWIPDAGVSVLGVDGFTKWTTDSTHSSSGYYSQTVIGKGTPLSAFYNDTNIGYDDNSGKFTLTIDDDPAVASVSVVANNSPVAEGNPGDANKVTFTVTVLGAEDREVRVMVQTEDLQANDPALRAGVSAPATGSSPSPPTGTQADYQSVSQELVFAAGSAGAARSKTVEVTINGDKKVELLEKFRLKATVTNNPNTTSPAEASAIGGIANDDTGKPKFIVAPTNLLLAEGQTLTTPNYVITDTDTAPQNLTFSVTGLPDHITSSTIVVGPNNQLQVSLNGRLDFNAAEKNTGGKYNLVFTVTDQDDNVVTLPVTWTVTNVSLASVKATEKHNSTLTPNSIAVSNATTLPELWFALGNFVQLAIAKNPANASTIKASDVKIQVETILTGSKTTLTYANSVLFKPTKDVKVDIFLDDNLNGSFEESAKLSFKCSVVSFQGLTVYDRRTAGGPVENTAYPLRKNESIEVGGTFEFSFGNKANGNLRVPTGSPLIRSELYDIDNAKVAGGTEKMSYAFTSTGNDIGDHKAGSVKFYYDSNNNNKWDNNEPKLLNDQIFNVAAVENINVYMNYSSLVSVPPANLLTMIQVDEDIATRRDGAWDQRARIKFNVIPFGTPFNAALDNYNGDTGNYFVGLLGDSNAGGQYLNIAKSDLLLLFVETMYNPSGASKIGDLGLTKGAFLSVVDAQDVAKLRPQGSLILHELIHQVTPDATGNSEHSPDPNNVMYATANATRPMNQLDDTQAALLERHNK